MERTLREIEDERWLDEVIGGKDGRFVIETFGEDPDPIIDDPDPCGLIVDDGAPINPS